MGDRRYDQLVVLEFLLDSVAIVTSSYIYMLLIVRLFFLMLKTGNRQCASYTPDDDSDFNKHLVTILSWLLSALKKRCFYLSHISAEKG